MGILLWFLWVNRSAEETGSCVLPHLPFRQKERLHFPCYPADKLLKGTRGKTVPLLGPEHGSLHLSLLASWMQTVWQQKDDGVANQLEGAKNLNDHR